MILYKHLQDYNYYSELYDKYTIEECQDWKNKKHELGDLSKLSEKEKKLEKIKKKYIENVVNPLALYFVKGERYANKSETIRKLMERDRAKDDKLANAVEPKGVRCLNCSSLMTNCIERDLMSNHDINTEEVLFMFECGKCGKRRAFWENGREWEYKPTCSKCNSPVQAKSSRKGKILKTVYSCPQCGHEEVDTMDLRVKEEPIDPDFEKNRKKYCLSDKEGGEYLSAKAGLENLKSFTDEWNEKHKNKKLYNAIAKIKKLTIAELQALLSPPIEKAGYAKFEFEKPNIQRDVILGFSLQDNKSGREEYDSVHDLAKLIKKTLEGTNWKLMTDGINYRLGFLTGRLRGVEGEENIRKLVEENLKKRNKKSNKSIK